MKAGTTIRMAVPLLALAIGATSFADPQPAVAADNSGSSLPSTSSGTDAAQVDAQALERAKAKFAHALSIVDQFKDQAKAIGLAGDNWRFEMVGNLMKGSEADFASVSLARSFTDAMSASRAVARAKNEAASGGSAATSKAIAVATGGLGSTTVDLVYVPITPCRVLDTRQVAGASIGQGTTHSYYFSGSNPGAATTCSVDNQIAPPVIPAAFAANVTVDDSGYSGFPAGEYLQIFPQGGSTPTSFINFGPGQIVANAGIISLNESNGQFSIFSSAPVNVLVDTYGVFIAPQPTALNCVTATSTSSFFGVVSATCPASYTMTGGGCQSNSINDHTYETIPSSSTTWGCGFYPETGQTLGTTLTAYAVCCQVPGRLAIF